MPDIRSITEVVGLFLGSREWKFFVRIRTRGKRWLEAISGRPDKADEDRGQSEQREGRGSVGEIVPVCPLHS